MRWVALLRVQLEMAPCLSCVCVVLLFRQRAAYEIRLSLVSSEMCIGDSDYDNTSTDDGAVYITTGPPRAAEARARPMAASRACLSYPSDAVDDSLRVDPRCGLIIYQ